MTNEQHREANMKTLKILAALACAVLIQTGTARAKIGLTSQFLDVVFEGLKPGQSYNIRKVKGVPYTVKNAGDGPVDVIIEITVPQFERLVAPYERIPDPTWIKLSPDRIRIAPKSLGFSDIVIDIPDDPSLVGKHYQAMIWARTINTGMLAVGVKSRLRFSIGPGPKSLERESRRKAMVTLNYDLWPNSMHVRKAVAGMRHDVKRKEKKVYKLTNRNDDTIELMLKPLVWPKTTVRLPYGYEGPKDLSWVKFKPEIVKVKGGRVRDVKMIFDKVPEKWKGKKIAFLISVHLPIGTLVSATHRVFVTVGDGEQK